MKSLIHLCLALFISMLSISCQNDDTNDNTSMDEVTNTLTAGTSKIWRISKASLINGGAEIDITQNFNVKDDEFIFSGTDANGTLQWKKGFDIKTDATSAQETLLDKYVSSVSASFGLQNNSDTIVETGFANTTIEINEDNTISVNVTNEDTTIFNFTLVEKKQADYVAVPQTGLNFTNTFTFMSDDIGCCAPGMIGSYADNSLFLVTKDLIQNGGDGTGPERVLKFNLDSNSVTEKFFDQNDYVSKQLHIIGDKLVAIGGQYINTYDLDLNTEPTSITHGKKLSRFGMAVLDNDAYMIGGDLNNIEGNKIFKWNLESETLTEFATLPETKSGARATIVNDHLYVFGGRNEFLGSIKSNKIHKVDISNGTQIETFEMNKATNYTFVQKYQHLIYVAGQIEIPSDDDEVFIVETTIGVFNTLDNTYQELASNLTNPTNRETIHQMAIFNGKMYIIYGGKVELEPVEWDVLVADLD